MDCHTDKDEPHPLAMLLFLCAPLKLCVESSLSLTSADKAAVRLLGDPKICFPLGSRSFIPLCLLAEMKKGNFAVSGKMSVWYPHLRAVLLGIILP